MNIFKEILNSTTTLETDKLVVKPISFDTKILKDLYEIYSDKENIKYYCPPFFNLLEFSNYMIAKINFHQTNLNGIISFAIKLKENLKTIGVRNIILDGKYRFDNQDKSNPKNILTEIILNKSYWKNGFATEASDLIFNHLKEFDIDNVLSIINKDNVSAIKLDEKLNFFQTNMENAIKKYNYDEDFLIHGQDIFDVIIYIKILKIKYVDIKDLF
jgi:RimJ/RimL family protein N-acetyltransferase